MLKQTNKTLTTKEEKEEFLKRRRAINNDYNNVLKRRNDIAGALRQIMKMKNQHHRALAANQNQFSKYMQTTQPIIEEHSRNYQGLNREINSLKTAQSTQEAIHE